MNPETRLIHLLITIKADVNDEHFLISINFTQNRTCHRFFYPDRAGVVCAVACSQGPRTIEFFLCDGSVEVDPTMYSARRRWQHEASGWLILILADVEQQYLVLSLEHADLLRGCLCSTEDFALSR